MKRILTLLEQGLFWVEKAVTILTCSVMCTIVFLQVLFRYVFRISAVWTEEIALICFLYSVFLGASIVIVKAKHIGFDAIVTLVPKRFHVLFWLISDLTVMAFLVIMIRSGYRFAIAGRTNVSPMLRIPMSYLFAVIPISGCTMLVHTLSGFLKEFAVQVLGRRPAEGG